MHSDSRTWGRREYKVRKIKAMRTENGKREWLVAWEAIDGQAFEDSWEPIKNVSGDLMVTFRKDQQEKIQRSILVDSGARWGSTCSCREGIANADASDAHGGDIWSRALAVAAGLRHMDEWHARLWN